MVFGIDPEETIDARWAVLHIVGWKPCDEESRVGEI